MLWEMPRGLHFLAHRDRHLVTPPRPNILRGCWGKCHEASTFWFADVGARRGLRTSAPARTSDVGARRGPRMSSAQPSDVGRRRGLQTSARDADLGRRRRSLRTSDVGADFRRRRATRTSDVGAEFRRRRATRLGRRRKSPANPFGEDFNGKLIFFN